MVLKEALTEHFALFGVTVSEEATLNKCLDLCDLYNLDEESLVETWMAFSVSHCQGDNPTVEYLCQMEKKELKKELVPSSGSLSPFVKVDKSLSKIAAYNSATMKQYDDNEAEILELYGGKTPTTPKSKRLRSPEGELDFGEAKIRAVESAFSPSSYSPGTGTPSRLSSSALNRGKILLKFGKEDGKWKTAEGDKRAVKVSKSEYHDHIPSQALYMYEKLVNKAGALDLTCEELGQSMCSISNEIEKVEIEQVGSHSRSQYQLQTYGRICCDSDGKLNTASVLLEGSRSLSSGLRVKLDLGKLSQYSIFPGQIVAVKGINPTGNSLVLKNLFFESPPPPLLAKMPPKMEKLDNNDHAQDLQVVVAAGPFTTGDNLKYQPLKDLSEYIVENQPHVVVLVGPFVEFSHPDIQKCNMSSSFDDFFEQSINYFMHSLEDTFTQVVLVSSNRDVHHEPVYPTPEFRMRVQYPNLHLMPDPCMIDIEGLVIATTSVDSLMHLGREEISFNATRFDRITRLATHILAQRCFYPLVPPSEEVNVDTDLWEKYAFMKHQPHILILPSNLRYFCKNIYDCVVLNPERLAKGSFARIRVTTTSNSDSGEWKAADNVAVQILKV